MKIKSLFIILLCSLLLTIACKQHNVYKVHIYKVKKSSEVTSNDNQNAWMFWYVIMLSNNSGYYTYSSNTQVSVTVNIQWVKLAALPFNEENIEEEQVTEVNPEQLENEIQEDVINNISEEEVSQTEAGQTSPAESTPSESNSSSSDSGGDSGGGDGD
jgi:hypothetical protein